MAYKEIFLVDNVKCNGCANTIKNNLSTVENVQAVDVDVEANKVEVSFINQADDRAKLLSILERAGYPEQGMSSMKHKVKSYVSCAIGRIND